MSQTILRQIECLKLLSKDRSRTAGELHKALADRGFITSKRTVERDLQMLSSSMQITAEEDQKPFGWKYNKDAALSLMPGLSETEALSFLLLKQFVSRLLPSSIEDDLEFYFKNASKALSENISKSAVRKWPSKVRIVETSIALQKPKNDPKVQKELYNALFRSKQIAITYVPAGREEGRSYSPINLLGLIEHGAVIYLVVNFASYEDIRLLALHRIRKAQMLDTPTVYPHGFSLDDYIANGGMGFGGDGKEIQLKLRFYDGAGYAYLEATLSKDQKVLKKTDRVLEISATVQNTVRLQQWLRGLGQCVEVLAPLALREEMKKSLTEACSRYQE